jgi:hypothetical protein
LKVGDGKCSKEVAIHQEERAEDVLKNAIESIMRSAAVD